MAERREALPSVNAAWRKPRRWDEALPLRRMRGAGIPLLRGGCRHVDQKHPTRMGIRSKLRELESLSLSGCGLSQNWQSAGGLLALCAPGLSGRSAMYELIILVCLAHQPCDDRHVAKAHGPASLKTCLSPDMIHSPAERALLRRLPKGARIVQDQCILTGR